MKYVTVIPKCCTKHHADVEKWACSVVGYTPKTINRRVTYRRIVLKAFYLLTGYLSGAASMAEAIKARDEERRRAHS